MTARHSPDAAMIAALRRQLATLHSLLNEAAGRRTTGARSSLSNTPSPDAPLSAALFLELCEAHRELALTVERLKVALNRCRPYKMAPTITYMYMCIDVYILHNTYLS